MRIRLLSGADGKLNQSIKIIYVPLYFHLTLAAREIFDKMHKIKCFFVILRQLKAEKCILFPVMLLRHISNETPERNLFFPLSYSNFSRANEKHV